jgi:hypothetical protein
MESTVVWGDIGADRFVVLYRASVGRGYASKLFFARHKTLLDDTIVLLTLRCMIIRLTPGVYDLLIIGKGRESGVVLIARRHKTRCLLTTMSYF